LGGIVGLFECSQLDHAVDGHVPAAGEERHRASVRIVSPGFFATLGLPIVEGRDFDDADRNGGELVAIVSQSVAQRMFPRAMRSTII
jgi:putative ABC transport system permease protein